VYLCIGAELSTAPGIEHGVRSPNGEVAAAIQCLLSLVALCEIDTRVTLTAGLHFVDGESSRIEGEHREELEPSIAGLDE
jgi:hypothetical protein